MTNPDETAHLSPKLAPFVVAPEPSLGGQNSLRGKRILLVEDSPVNRKVALALLNRWECVTVAVENGMEAVKAVQTCPPDRWFDCVLMDVQMPVMDGWEATRQIREYLSQTAKTLPIIALTSQATPLNKQRFLQAGMDDCLPKPIEPPILAAVLAHWARTQSAKPQDSFADFPLLPALQPKANSPAIDTVQLMEHCFGDSVLALEVVEDYLRSTPNLVSRLSHAAAQSDVTALEKEAQMLQSASRIVGAKPLAVLCEQVENHAQSPETLTLRVAVLLREWERVQIALGELHL